MDAEQQLTEQRSEESFILDALGLGVLSGLEDGTITKINTAATRILRRTGEGLLGRNVSDVVASLSQLQNTPLEPITKRQELPVTLGDGTAGAVGFAIATFTGPDQRAHFVLQFQDIAPVRELRRQRDRLMAFAAVGDALPTVLHELRNPLAAITTHLEILVEEHEGLLQEDLNTLLTEVQRISLCLDGVSGFVRPARAHGLTAADSAVQDACRVLTPIAKRHGVELVTAVVPLPPLPLDRGVLSGIVFNLVKNALDASKPGHRVRVSMDLEENRRTLCLSVSDDGVGMTREVLSQCTDLFYTSKEKGSGIGLALCKRVAESAGGSLEVESELGSGTIVRVRLPVEVERSEPTRAGGMP
ncbi:MAG: ATP-binding protein [Polyangiaceae bacterium]